MLILNDILRHTESMGDKLLVVCLVLILSGTLLFTFRLGVFSQTVLSEEAMVFVHDVPYLISRTGVVTAGAETATPPSPEERKYIRSPAVFFDRAKTHPPLFSPRFDVPAR